MRTPGVKGLVIEKGCKVQGSRFTGEKKEQKMQDTRGKKENLERDKRMKGPAAVRAKLPDWLRVFGLFRVP
jgi:hypothetical protein